MLPTPVDLSPPPSQKIPQNKHSLPAKSPVSEPLQISPQSQKIPLTPSKHALHPNPYINPPHLLPSSPHPSPSYNTSLTLPSSRNARPAPTRSNRSTPTPNFHPPNPFKSTFRDQAHPLPPCPRSSLHLFLGGGESSYLGLNSSSADIPAMLLLTVR